MILLDKALEAYADIDELADDSGFKPVTIIRVRIYHFVNWHFYSNK